MEEKAKTLVEEREEEFIGSTQRRKAHFLQPSNSSIEGQIFELPSHTLSCLHSSPNPKSWDLKVNFLFWKSSGIETWKKWVSKMVSLHESTWKKVGIYQAIMTSTYTIYKDEVLILGLAEKWCCQTKSFIFPWGEATITLEDLLVSWGYPVLGTPVLVLSGLRSYYEFMKTREMKDVEEKLEGARMELIKTKAKKAHFTSWINKFIDSRIEFEHEAFLAYWLSRFVFPRTCDSMSKFVFPIAVHLARGNKVAIAQAVLANIYRDLSLLKSKINLSTKLENVENSDCLETVTIKTPFSIIQVWVWERFSKLSPIPNVIKNDEPRLARWHRKKFTVKEDAIVRSILDSSADHFNWRPYAKNVYNFDFPEFYKDSETWVLVDSGSDEELKSFVECIKVSDLEGLDCFEWYYPNRVGMQFGFDQDIPTCPSNTHDVCRKAIVYVPPRSFVGSVTVRYLDWWRNSVIPLEKASKYDSTNLKRPREQTKNSKPRKKSEKDTCNGTDDTVQKELNKFLAPPGYGWKQTKVESEHMSEKEANSSEMFKFSNHYVVQEELNNSLVPSCQTPNIESDSIETFEFSDTQDCNESTDDDEDKLTLAEMYKISKNNNENAESVNDCEIFSSSYQDNKPEVIVLSDDDDDNDVQIADNSKHGSSSEKLDVIKSGDSGLPLLVGLNNLMARFNTVAAKIKARTSSSSSCK